MRNGHLVKYVERCLYEEEEEKEELGVSGCGTLRMRIRTCGSRRQSDLGRAFCSVCGRV